MTQPYAYASSPSSWSTGTIPTSYPFNYLTFANGKFFASGAYLGNANYGVLGVSATGLPGSWTVTDYSSLIGGLNAIGPVKWAPSASLYFAFVYQSSVVGVNHYITSPDGATWTVRSLPSTSSFYNFTATASLALITSTPDSSYPVSTAYSTPDLVTLTSVGTARGPTQFIGSEWCSLESNNSDRSFYSPDLSSWTTVTLPSYGYGSASGLILRNFVSEGYGYNSLGINGPAPTSGDFIYTSNGTTWSASTTPNPANSYNYKAIADDGTTALLVGDGIKAYSTTTLSTWGTVTLPNITAQYTGIAHGASEWVALGPTTVNTTQIVMVI